MLALGAALVAGVLWLASGGAFQKHYDLYLAIEDESVAGLNLNAPVKYNGVDVGKVREIALDTTNPERVNLLFAIERGTPIKVDTVAVLKTQGLTGIAYVELSGGARDAAPLQATAGSRYPVIRTKPSLSARLENVLTSMLAKLDSTSTSINAILSDENRIAFKNALADIATVARTSVNAGKTVGVVGAGVSRFAAETLPELERLLGELSVLSVSLRRLSEQTERNPAGLLFGRRPVPEGPGETSITPGKP